MRTPFAAALAIVLVFGCSDQPTTPTALNEAVVANAVDGVILQRDVTRSRGLSLAVASSTTAATCGDILIYDNNSIFSHARNAVTDLGLPFTHAVSGNFNTLLTGQTWDLVIMDNPSNEPTSGWQTNIANHIGAGGLAIHTHWNPFSLTAALQAAFEIANTVDRFTPLDFYQWNGHPLFTTPNSIPKVFDVWADIIWNRNGFRVDPTGSAVAAAGFVPTPTAGQAGIVIGNSGRTIFNGFLFDDYEPADKDTDSQKDIEELIQNEVELLCSQLIEVDIDIKPGSDPNSINPASRGVVPVAILGSGELDVNDIDRTTLAFGPDGATPAHKALGHLENVNGDAYLDLVSHYRQQETGLSPGDTEACVTGETVSGILIEGCDAVRVLNR